MSDKDMKLYTPKVAVITPEFDFSIAKQFLSVFSLHLTTWEDREKVIWKHCPSLLMVDLDYCEDFSDDVLKVVQENIPDSLKVIVFYSNKKVQLVLNPRNGEILQPIINELSEPEIISALYGLLDADPLDHFHDFLGIVYRELSIPVRNVIDICCLNYVSIMVYDDLLQSFNRPIPESPFQFERETGISFEQYLHRLKIEMSIGIMTNTDIPLETISQMVGYSSFNLFSKNFEKYYGLKPDEYRKLTLLRNKVN